MTRRIGRRRTKAEIETARKRALAARKRHLLITHHMTLEQYESLKAFQGGACLLCARAKGITKALAVEHDHAKARRECAHDPDKQSCENCWRGLACGMCNKILGFFRDDPGMAIRFYSWLTDPPAQLWRKNRESIS